MIPDSEILCRRYRVLRREEGSIWELGRGALGVTYKAIDLRTNLPVVVKSVPLSVLWTSAVRERLLGALSAAKFLPRPPALPVAAMWWEGDAFYYVMDFVEGETLMSLVRHRGPLPPAAALDITLQAARSLSALHEHGLVHRDIKPQNILLAQAIPAAAPAGAVELIDVGFAKGALEGLPNDTPADGLNPTEDLEYASGNPTYLCPEELEENPQDTRSDIYCLGLVLWFLLTGQPPFAGTLSSIFIGHLQKPPPFERLPPGQCPPPVRALLERMLAKDPAARPQNPPELCREIEASLASLPPSPSAECACLQNGPVDYENQPLGVDFTKGRFGEVTLRTCRGCGRRWLHYLFEHEAFSRSGRWFLGLLPDELPLPLAAENAVPILDRLPWHFYGGSNFHLPPPGRRGTAGQISQLL